MHVYIDQQLKRSKEEQKFACENSSLHVKLYSKKRQPVLICSLVCVELMLMGHNEDLKQKQGILMHCGNIVHCKMFMILHKQGLQKFIPLDCRIKGTLVLIW